MNKKFDIELVKGNAGNAFEALLNTSNPEEVMAAFGMLCTWYHRELATWVPSKIVKTESADYECGQCHHIWSADPKTGNCPKCNPTISKGGSL